MTLLSFPVTRRDTLSTAAAVAANESVGDIDALVSAGVGVGVASGGERAYMWAPHLTFVD